MIIGVDFDNTIVSYDALFYTLAVDSGLVPAEVVQTKESVRDYLRKEGKEDQWTVLQGEVYGNQMHHAVPFEGVFDFFSLAVHKGHQIKIVSHKTKAPFLGPAYDLHTAARTWLESQGVFRIINHDDVFFEITKKEKLQRIATLKCKVFIDDLPEIFTDTDFPNIEKRILFAPQIQADIPHDVSRVTSWSVITQELLHE